MKRIFTFLTALVMVFPLSACQKKKTGATLKVSLETSYISEPISYKTQRLTPLLPFGNGVLLCSKPSYTGQGVRYVWWNAETGDLSEMQLHNKGKSHGEGSVLILPGDKLGIVFQKQNASGSSWDPEATDAYIDVYDKELQYLETFSIPEIEGGIGYSFCSAHVNGTDYLLFETNAPDTYEHHIFIYDMETMDVTGVLDKSCNLVQGSSGDIYAVMYMGSGYTLARIDIEQCKLEPVSFAEDSGMWQTDNLSDVQHVITGADGYELYNYGMDTLYGLRIDGNTAESELLMDFVNSDFVNDFSLDIAASPDGRFLIYENADSTQQLWATRKRTTEELESCQVITMAGVNFNTQLENTIILYNRTHSDYHISMVDYRQFIDPAADDYDAYYRYSNHYPGLFYGMRDAVGVDQIYENASGETLNVREAAAEIFRQDLLDGIVPDIICTDNLPFAQLANKGLFLDMAELMEKDERFRKEDYMMNFFDSMKFRGEQQTIAFSFYVNTIVGKSERVGSKSGLSSEEYLAMIEANTTDDIQAFSYYQDDYKETFLPWMQNSFLDTEAASCCFDSPAFVNLLELGNSFQKNIFDDDYVSAGSKDAILHVYSFDQPINYHELHAGVYKNEDVTLVGFPAVDGGNGGIFSAPYTLAINAMSEHQDKIWEIFMELLSEDVQRKFDISDKIYSFPVLRSAFKEDMEAATKGANRQYNGAYIGAATEAEYDFLTEYIESITMFYYNDPQITNIISEETDKFYAGDQTAEEAASMVQSRVSLYLSEQY